MTATSNSSAQTSTSTIAFVAAQPANQYLARVFLGANVTNPAGNIIGEIYDLMFDQSGQICTVSIGVGGFLGMGEKIIAVPFSDLKMDSETDGERTITLVASKDALQIAPAFVATEKTSMDAIRDTAIDIGHRTVDKANELKDQAARKLSEMVKKQSAKK